MDRQHITCGHINSFQQVWQNCCSSILLNKKYFYTLEYYFRSSQFCISSFYFLKTTPFKNRSKPRVSINVYNSYFSLHLTWQRRKLYIILWDGFPWLKIFQMSFITRSKPQPYRYMNDVRNNCATSSELIKRILLKQCGASRWLSKMTSSRTPASQ